MENNIFNIEMSELVHDNILTWIIRGFNSSNKKSSLYEFSFDFLELMGIEASKYSKVIVEQQYKLDLGIKEGNIRRSSGYVDILARFINDKDEDDQYLVIEDKIYTEEHDNQFVEYVKGIRNDINLINRDKTKFVYIKLGKITNASKKKAETEDENKITWKIITSQDLLKLFPKNFQAQTHDDCVLKCYKEFLEELKRNYNSFKEIKLDEWSEHSIFGFFDNLAQKCTKSGLKSDFIYKSFGESGHGEFLTEEKTIKISEKYECKIYVQLKLYSPVKPKIYSLEKDINKSRVDKWETSIVIEDITDETSDCNEKKGQLIKELGKHFDLDRKCYPIKIITQNGKCIKIFNESKKYTSNTDFIKDTDDLINSYKNIDINKIRQLVNDNSKD